MREATVPDADPDTGAVRRELPAGPRLAISKGLLTIGSATVVLFVVSALAAPSRTSSTALQGMLPIASVLAVAGLGQMLVIQQGGIDLSVAGAISMTVIVVTHIPDGDNGKLFPAVLIAVLFALGAGILNGLLIGVLTLNPIIATLGTNALLYGADLGLSGGRPRITTKLLASLTGGSTAGIPNAVFFAVAALVVVTVLLRRTVAGRRFEAIGANPAPCRWWRRRTASGPCYGVADREPEDRVRAVHAPGEAAGRGVARGGGGGHRVRDERGADLAEGGGSAGQPAVSTWEVGAGGPGGIRQAQEPGGPVEGVRSAPGGVEGILAGLRGAGSLGAESEGQGRGPDGHAGRGNHFLEVCSDDEGVVWVVLHSGSRNIGKELAEYHIETWAVIPRA
jgi:hypothetical protein